MAIPFLPSVGFPQCFSRDVIYRKMQQSLVIMKPQLTIALLLLFISSTLIGQNGIEFKVKILPDNTSYQVLARPNFTADNVAISGSQVTLRVPLGGFEIGNITNHLGD